VYDFDELDPNFPEPNAVYGSCTAWDGNGCLIEQQGTTMCTWVPVGTSNWGKAFKVCGDPYVTAMSGSQEQLLATLSGGEGSAKPINLDSDDTRLDLYYVGWMNVTQGALVGVWVDGIDANANGKAGSDNLELLCQFGVSSGKWRIRGVEGGGSVNTDANGLAANTTKYLMKVTLRLDLAGNGTMSLIVDHWTNGTSFAPAAYQGKPLGLTGKDPNYADPSKWTSWWIRSQASGYSNTVGGYTLDNLTVLVPEPATLSLLVLGGLACIRRRR